MDFSSHKDYKSAIRARFKEVQETRPSLTLKKVAAKIPIQYTYLSKVLNDRDTHLSEDDLFRVGEILELFPQEVEHLLLLRAYQTALLPSRREFLFHGLEKHRKKAGTGIRAKIQETDVSHLTQEMSYLFDPFCIIVYVALNIPRIFEDPRLLCTLLGITPSRLKEILKKLSLLDFIELGAGPLTVKKLNQNRLHYPKEHPLIRVHQHLLKSACHDQLLKTAEEDKESFQVTFTADRKAFEQIKSEFHSFLKKVEDIVRPSKDENVLQMTFDLFMWM